jgi:hypothetical protein
MNDWNPDPQDIPVDGFSVEGHEDYVILILSSRYGTGDRYEFPRDDAHRIGQALIDCAADDPRLDQY